MKKRYIITGHGRGLGRAWYEHFKYFELMGLEVLGFGQVAGDGYDLVKNFEQVCAAAEGADVFINNAYQHDLQLKFLNRLHHRVGAMIISGSVASDDLGSPPEDPQYGQFKRDLEQRVLELGRNKAENQCDLLYLKLTGHAYRDTAGIIKLTDHWLTNRKMFFVQFPNVKDITN
jgi:hypothetical protein